MTRTILLNDGKRIPAMGWGSGTYDFFRNGKLVEEKALVALKAGVRHIDTAQVYETEADVGSAIRKSGIPRAEIWLTSKISESSKTACTPEDVRRSVTESIKAMGYIPDLYLLHNPFLHEVIPSQPAKTIADFYTYVEDLVLDGTLKGCSLGVSNFRPQDLEAVLKVARIIPVVNRASFFVAQRSAESAEIEFHPYLLAHYDALFALQEKYGIVTQSFGGLSPLIKHPTGGPILPVLQRIGAARKIDVHTVLYLWQLSKNINVITTSGNPKNIQKIVEVDSPELLSPADVEDIDQAGRKVYWRNQPEHMEKDFPPPPLPSDVKVAA